MPGVGSSFCRSASTEAFGANVIAPLKFTESLPVPPLTVKLGNVPVKAPMLIVSLPPAALTVMDVTADLDTALELPRVAAAPSTLNQRPVAANWILPDDGSVTFYVSPLLLISVATIALPVVVIV